VRPQTGWG